MLTICSNLGLGIFSLEDPAVSDRVILLGLYHEYLPSIVAKIV